MKSWPLLTLAVVTMAAAIHFSAAKGRDEIRPLHAVHAENELECTDCHADVVTSVLGSDLLTPKMAFCADCHDVENPDECSKCHTAPENAVAMTPPAVATKFPHKTHLDEGMECVSCHALDAHGEYSMPSMQLCRSCHETASEFDDCGVCHGKEETLRPISHSPNWQHLHGQEAGWDDVSCLSCHTQTDCLDCHASDNVRPRSHGLDFAFSHALEARADDTQCATCHMETEFCSSCHLAEQVLPENHSRGDWVLGSTGGAHAEEARFDLEGCAGCHDSGTQDPVCAQCHGE